MSASFPVSPVPHHHEDRHHLRRLWWLFLILGIASIVIGFVAISSYFMVSIATALVFGILLLIAGITEVIHAIMVRNWRGFALHLLTAALYLITGLFMVENPAWTVEVLVFILAASFLAGGLLRIIFAMVERFSSWGWVVLHGVVDLLLGVMILNAWPESSFRILGLFIGIDLIFHGWAWVILGLTVRSVASTLAKEQA
jgi:uncharacterized membrane protein HdeD (DUF308 family)